MANDCLPQVAACMVRVARLDSNGVPTPGANNLYTSDALTTFQFAWEVQAGDEITENNGCGVQVINFKAPDTLRRGNITIGIVTPDPQLSEMLSGGDVITSGAAVGVSAPPLGELLENPISIEIWAKRIRSGHLDPVYPYARWVYPWVSNVRPDDHTQDNSALKPQFIGQAFENTNWFNGPLNDWPVASDRVYQWLPVTTIPSANCGYQTIAAS